MATKFCPLPQPLPVLDLLQIVLEIALVLAKHLVDSVCKNPCLNWTKTHQDMGSATSPTFIKALHKPTSTMVSTYCTASRHKKLGLYPSVIAQWSKDNDTRMNILLHRHWSVIWDIVNVLEGLKIPQTTARPSNTHASLSGATPFLGRNRSIYAHP